MIEIILKNYLDSKLEVFVGLEKPDNPPLRYVVIEKTAGRERDHIESATVAIQSYAESLYQAALLNNMVKAAMRDIIELPEASSAKLNSDYNYTDTTKKQYRYQAVYDLVYFDNEEG